MLQLLLVPHVTPESALPLLEVAVRMETERLEGACLRTMALHLPLLVKEPALAQLVRWLLVTQKSCPAPRILGQLKIVMYQSRLYSLERVRWVKYQLRGFGIRQLLRDAAVTQLVRCGGPSVGWLPVRNWLCIVTCPCWDPAPPG